MLHYLPNRMSALQAHRRLYFAVLGIITLMVGALLYSFDAAHQSLAGGRADIAIILTPVPNVGVTPGSILTYQVQVRNFNSSSADRVLVHMPYNPAQLQVLDANFTDSEDWITGVQGDYLTMSFGKVAGHSSRTATIRMLVAQNLPVGTVINMWAGYGWDDGNGGGQGQSANAAPVVVEADNINSGALWMSVEPPIGPPGTLYGFFTNRFVPGERLHVSLNAPYGNQPVNMDRDADEMGQAWFVFDSTGYPPGAYQLAVRGERSGQLAVADFIVE